MKKMSFVSKAYMVLIFSFMYVPIAVMAVFSFNESRAAPTLPDLPLTGISTSSATI